MSGITADVINLIFSAALFFNAILFIPQAVRIVKEKTAEGISLITFSGFLIIQLATVFHAVAVHDYILMSGYLLSLMTCGSVTLLALIYKKKAKKNIRDLATLEEIVAQLPGHIYVKDREYILRWNNSNNWKDFGFNSLESSIGKTDYDFFEKNIADKVRAVDKIVIEQGIEQIIEEVNVCSDGAKVTYLSHKKPLRNAKGDVIGLVGYSVDITKSKKEITDELNILDSIIAEMPGNVYWMNRDGVYLGCNNNQANVAGLTSRGQIVGKRNIDIPGFLIPEKLDPVNQAIMTEGIAVTLEEPAHLTNGEDAVFLSNKVPLRDTEGKVIGLLGISIDITDKKKAERELIEAKEAAEAADRAKTEFLANMSHDVKTPLSGVIGMADLMMHDFKGQDYQRARAIYLCGMQLLSFFNSCLDLSKLEMKEWAAIEEVFSLSDMLNEISALLSPAAEMKGLTLTTEIDSALPAAVRGHRASVYRILLNLIGNALKFTPKGGVHVRGFLAEKLSSNEVRIGLSVKDTGIGIPADKHTVIFEKMRRLEPAYEGRIEGSGIGLYIVDQYVKRMGGNIQVESMLGEGSTFTVLLPMKLASKNDLDPLDRPEACLSSYTETPQVQFEENALKLPDDAPCILLVEDNPLIQHVTQSLLNDAGFKVDVAGTGGEALKQFSPGKYRLIYMDIGLPDQDGYAVTEAIRKKEAELKLAAVPIIALTAHGAVDVEVFCGRAGMQGVLSKPLTREQADAVWKKFGLGQTEEIAGLTLIESSEKMPGVEKVIDLEGTVALLGSKEYAKELFGLWYEMLNKRFLPALKDLVAKRDDEGLRHELHNMLGSLCYVKTPLLNQAVLELQTAARNHPQSVESAYQHLVAEAERFISQYQQQFC